jgi:hypothetical protein
MKKLILYLGIFTIILSLAIFYPSFNVQQSIPVEQLDGSVVKSSARSLTPANVSDQFNHKTAYHRKSYE